MFRAMYYCILFPACNTTWFTIFSSSKLLMNGIKGIVHHLLSYETVLFETHEITAESAWHDAGPKKLHLNN